MRNNPIQRTGALSDSAPMTALEDRLEDTTLTGKDSPDWQEKQKECLENLRPDSARSFARELRVSQESLERLGLGFDEYAYTFPMRDSAGTLCGIRTRPVKGSKLTMAGGKRGLFIPEGVQPGRGVLICEGESDTAAALTLGFRAIGLPGAGQAIAHAVNFFRRSKTSLPCIIGDNDPAGKDGAENLAEAMLEEGIQCRVVYPPGDCSDLREWIERDELDFRALEGAIHDKPMRYPEKWAHGFQQIPNAFFRAEITNEIGPTASLVLFAICSFNGSNGEMFPSREWLAAITRRSVCTIDRTKRLLKDKGLLSWNRGRKGRCNDYAVHLDDYSPPLEPKATKTRRKPLDIPVDAGNNKHRYEQVSTHKYDGPPQTRDDSRPGRGPDDSGHCTGDRAQAPHPRTFPSGQAVASAGQGRCAGGVPRDRMSAQGPEGR